MHGERGGCNNAKNEGCLSLWRKDRDKKEGKKGERESRSAKERWRLILYDGPTDDILSAAASPPPPTSLLAQVGAERDRHTHAPQSFSGPTSHETTVGKGKEGKKGAFYLKGSCPPYCSLESVCTHTSAIRRRRRSGERERERERERIIWYTTTTTGAFSIFLSLSLAGSSSCNNNNNGRAAPAPDNTQFGPQSRKYGKRERRERERHGEHICPKGERESARERTDCLLFYCCCCYCPHTQ